MTLSTMGRMVERAARVVGRDQERADLFAEFPSGTWVTVELDEGQILDRTRGGVLLINGCGYVAVESLNKPVPLSRVHKAFAAWVRLTRPKVLCRWVEGIWPDRLACEMEIAQMRAKYPDIVRAEISESMPTDI